MNERKLKKKFSHFFFDMGFKPSESRKLAYKNLIMCKDFTGFENIIDLSNDMSEFYKIPKEKALNRIGFHKNLLPIALGDIRALRMLGVNK